MEAIQESTDSILQFLELDKRSELQAEQMFLAETVQDLEDITLCEAQRQASVVNAQNTLFCVFYQAFIAGSQTLVIVLLLLFHSFQQTLEVRSLRIPGEHDLQENSCPVCPEGKLVVGSGFWNCQGSGGGGAGNWRSSCGVVGKSSYG